MEDKKKKVGLYIAVGTLVAISICAGVIAVVKKSEKCKDY